MTKHRTRRADFPGLLRDEHGAAVEYLLLMAGVSVGLAIAGSLWLSSLGGQVLLSSCEAVGSIIPTLSYETCIGDQLMATNTRPSNPATIPESDITLHIVLNDKGTDGDFFLATVHDPSHAPVPGAEVVGFFLGPSSTWTKGVSCSTNEDGTYRLSTEESEASLQITNVSGDNVDYQPQYNHD